MVKKILSERKRIWIKNVTHDFMSKEDPQSGFSFPMDGNLNLCSRVVGEDYEGFGAPTEEAIKNYAYCQAHPELYEDEGVKDRGWWYLEPAHAICEVCGREIILDGDRACECGQWHNDFGQSLLPPEYWEEDEY